MQTLNLLRPVAVLVLSGALLSGHQCVVLAQNEPGREGDDRGAVTTVQRSDEEVEDPQAPRDPGSRAQSAFSHVNGVRHHYLDWGGQGDVVLLLAGLGNTAHVFESFGSVLADDYRVLALTRRGHGQSASPEGGYDTKTRVEDIRAFLDALQVKKVILIGHSIAGDEITVFSATYPERTKAAVYLDAAYDRRQLSKLNARNPLRIRFPANLTQSYERYVSFMRASEPALEKHWEKRAADVEAQIKRLGNGGIEVRTSPAVYGRYRAEMGRFQAEYGRVKAPVLSIYATSERHPVIPTFIGEEMREQADTFWKEVRMPAARRQMRLFQEALPDATVVEVKEADHFCFIGREADVIGHIRAFLGSIGGQHEE